MLVSRPVSSLGRDETSVLVLSLHGSTVDTMVFHPTGGYGLGSGEQWPVVCTQGAIMYGAGHIVTTTFVQWQNQVADATRHYQT